MTSRSFGDLAVWQKAHKWVLAIYKTTEQFPKQEMFGLTSQLRCAAVSVPANIAEGYRKRVTPIKSDSIISARDRLKSAAII